MEVTNSCLTSAMSSEYSTFPFLLLTFPYSLMQFRAAIQLQFDFHRAIYNLGTVLVIFPLHFSHI